ncbi:MAG TPA: hypothetical protein VGB13_10025, partial [Candidatus Krumholzibacteria bacterium]
YPYDRNRTLVLDKLTVDEAIDAAMFDWREFPRENNSVDSREIELKVVAGHLLALRERIYEDQVKQIDAGRFRQSRARDLFVAFGEVSFELQGGPVVEQAEAGIDEFSEWLQGQGEATDSDATGSAVVDRRRSLQQSLSEALNAALATLPASPDGCGGDWAARLEDIEKDALEVAFDNVIRSRILEYFDAATSD